MKEPWENFQSASATAEPWEQFKKTETAQEPWEQFGGAKPQAKWGDVGAAIPTVARAGTEKAIGGFVRGVGDLVLPRVEVGMPNSTIAEDQKVDAVINKNKIAETGTGMFEVGSDREKAATPDNMSYGQRAVLSGVSSVAQQVPAIALSIASRNVTPIIGTAVGTTGASSYGEKKAAGIDSATAAGSAAIDAAAEGLLELIPAKFLMSNLKAPTFQLLKGILIREPLTEAGTAAIQSANAKFTDKPNMTGEEYFQSILDAAGAAVVAGPMTAGIAKGIDKGVRTAEGLMQPSLQTQGIKSAEQIIAELEAQAQTGSAAATPEAPKTPAEELGLELPESPPQVSKSIATQSISPEMQAMMDSIDEELNRTPITPEQVQQAEAVIAQAETAKTEAARVVDPEVADEMSEIDFLHQNRKNAVPDINSMTEIGNSAKKDANQYVNENDSVIPSQRSILFGPDGTVGKRFNEGKLSPGTYTIGVETADNPAAYLQAKHDTLEGWRQKFMPEATLILANQSPPTGNALGWHIRTKRGNHFMITAPLRNMKDPNKFEPKTQFSAFMNLTHEFGHALIQRRLFEAVDPAIVSQAMAESESQTGLVSEETLAQMPELQAGIVREFNEKKARILSGEMTAREFVNTWMNPAKIAMKSFLSNRNVAEDAPATQLVDKIIGRAIRNNRDLSAAGLAAMRSQFLGFDEYAAEQFARYAHMRNYTEGSPLNTPTFFQKAIANIKDSLVKYFKSLKAEGQIAPGVKFTEWVDGISGYTPTAAKPGSKAGKPKAKAKAKAAPKVKSKSPKADAIEGVAPEPADHVVSTMSPEKQVEYRKLVTGLIKDGTIEANGEEHKYWLSLIKAQDYNTFIDEIQPYLESKVKFELSDINIEEENFPYLHAGSPVSEFVSGRPEVQADAAREWKAKGFESRFFKSWFGDWQGDPKASSKAVDATGKPLPLFHSTQALVSDDLARRDSVGRQDEAPIHTFRYGDLGFHFGTVRAAHNRAIDTTAQQSTAEENMQFVEERLQTQFDSDRVTPFYIIPAVINLRNPLMLGDEVTAFWTNPVTALKYLAYKGFITHAEKAATEAIINSRQSAITNSVEENTQYDRFKPVRDLLKANYGYDGIIYNNAVEGDVSYVVFEPNQVKTLLGNKTFSRSPRIDYELDFDESTPDGHTAGQFKRKFARFFSKSEYSPLQRAFRAMTNMQYKVLQTQQLAHIHPENTGLQMMTSRITLFERFTSYLMATPNTVADEWDKLAKEQFAQSNNFLQAEVASGKLWVKLERVNGQWTYVPNEEFVKRLAEHKIDYNTEAGKETAEMILKLKNSFLLHINELQSVLVYLIGRRYEGKPDLLKAQLTIMSDKIRQLREQPYFPSGRFGNYIIVVRKKQADGKNKTVFRAHYESEQEWAAAFEDMRKRTAKDETLEKTQLTDTEYVLMSLPLDFVSLASSELGLTNPQVEQLLLTLQPIKIDKPLAKWDQARLKIKGGSEDTLRNYTDFMWHNSNMLSKLRFRAEFAEAINSVESERYAASHSLAPESLNETLKLTEIKRHMERTRDFIMSPPNEAHAVRSFVSLSYLAFNPKTALMNLSGFTTTWADFTTQLGQVEGNELMVKAQAAGMTSIFNPAAAEKMMSPATWQALERATEEGVLEQSYAYHLAGMANSSNLARLPGQRVLGQFSKKTIDYGMWTFRMAELFIRRSTFIAAHETALKTQNPLDINQDDPYTAAIKRVNLLQNDYSAGNRAPFLRGIKTKSGNKLIESLVPLATVFMTFSQNMAFHAYGGYELGLRRKARFEGKTPKSVMFGYTMKIWMILIILAGYEGLPGAENFLDVIDAAWKKLFHKPAREDIRELVRSIGADPVWASHGLGHNVAGFDVSRSVGLGRIFPGTDILSTSGGDLDRTAGAFVFDAFGPSGNMLHWMLKMGFSDKPWTEEMKRAPGALGNIVTAYSWAQDGVRNPLGSKITHDLTTGALRELTTAEIMWKAAGFNPAIVSHNREKRFAQHDARMYWTKRRERLMDDLWTATYKGDREAIADTRRAIGDYNSQIPKDYGPKLRITPKEMSASLKTRRKNQQLDQQGLPTQKRYRELYRNVGEDFSAPDESSP